MRKQFLNAATTVIIFITTLICISASPFSAITMIPVQVWQQLYFKPYEYKPIGDFERTNTTYVPGPTYRTYFDSRHVPSRQRHDLKCPIVGTVDCQKPIMGNMLPGLGASFTGPLRNGELVTEVVYSMYGAVRFDRPTSTNDYFAARAWCPIHSLPMHLKRSDRSSSVSITLKRSEGSFGRTETYEISRINATRQHWNIPQDEAENASYPCSLFSGFFQRGKHDRKIRLQACGVPI